MSTSKQIHLHYSENKSMHYAVFLAFQESHSLALHSKDNRRYTGTSVHILPVITAALLRAEETLSRWLVIVVRVLDVVYG